MKKLLLQIGVNSIIKINDENQGVTKAIARDQDGKIYDLASEVAKALGADIVTIHASINHKNRNCIGI